MNIDGDFGEDGDRKEGNSEDILKDYRRIKHSALAILLWVSCFKDVFDFVFVVEVLKK